MKIKNPLLIDPELAQKIGLNESIILQQLIYWIDKNRKKNTNYKDGSYWTYNSLLEWQKQFPFWSIATISRILKSLSDKKIIKISNYNKLGFDRTQWFSVDESLLDDISILQYEKCISQNETSILQNGSIDDSKLQNALLQNETTIPETNTETIQILTAETTAETTEETTEEKESVRGKEEVKPLPRTYKEQYLKYEAMLKERGFSYTENTLKTINTAVNYYKLSDQQTKKMINLFTDESQLNFKNINTVAAEISKTTSGKEVAG